MRHAIYAVTLTCLVSGTALADTTNFKIQTLVSELGGSFGSIDGQIGKMTRQAAAEVLGQDVSQLEIPALLAALEIAHAKKFDVVANSGAPCMNYLDRGANTIFLPDGSTKEGGSFAGEDANCRTIARLTQKSEFRGPIWDKPFFLKMDMQGENPRLVAWAAEMVAPYGDVIDTPGQAYLINLPLDIDEIFSTNSTTLLENIERPLPFSIRRGELSDIDLDGSSELVLLASREDGRGPDKSTMSMGVPVNQTDVNFVYKIEDSTAIPFAERSFSHDLVVADLDNDGKKEIIDLGYNKKGSSRQGFQVCGGEDLKCRWQFQEEIATGRTSIAFDKTLSSNILFGNCGTRHTNGLEDANQLCWFKVKYESSSTTPISFELIAKAENQAPYDTKQEMMNWMQFVAPQNGWKIPDIDPSQSFIMGGMGFHSALLDIDADGDLDTINYNANRFCRKQDPSAEYYEEIECDGVQAISSVFLQRNGKFERIEDYQEIHKNHLNALHYEFVDFDMDGAIDILNFARKTGYCIDPMTTSLRNTGNGEFEFLNRNQIMGQYGCEVQSAFFVHNGEPYRVFLSKAKYEKHNFENPEVFVSIEYLGRNSSGLLSDSGICDQAVRLVFSAKGKTWKWSEDAEAQEWVNEAKARGLDCGVGAASGSDSALQTEADSTAPETEKMTLQP